MLEQVTLKDISIRQKIRFLREENPVAANVLMHYEIYNYGQLQDYIESGIPEFQNPRLLKELESAKKWLEKIRNKEGNDPRLYTDAYENYCYPIVILNETDKLVNCSDLPLVSPLNFSSGFVNRVNEFSIYEAKQLMSLLDTGGDNALCCMIPSFGPIGLQRLYKAIRFYEEQILRNAASTPNISQYKGNLFTKDAKEKREILEQTITEMMNYLTLVGEEFIFGKFSFDQIYTLIESCINPKNKKAKEIRERAIKLIQDYTTLDELQSVESRQRVLHRFITKDRR